MSELPTRTLSLSLYQLQFAVLFVSRPARTCHALPVDQKSHLTPVYRYTTRLYFLQIHDITSCPFTLHIRTEIQCIRKQILHASHHDTSRSGSLPFRYLHVSASVHSVDSDLSPRGFTEQLIVFSRIKHKTPEMLQRCWKPTEESTNHTTIYRG